MAETSFFGEVYVHFCEPSQKCYVGQTTLGVGNRWCDHVKVSRWPNHVGYRYPLACAIRKYGAKRWANPEARERASRLAKIQRAREKAEKI